MPEITYKRQDTATSRRITFEYSRGEGSLPSQKLYDSEAIVEFAHVGIEALVAVLAEYGRMDAERYLALHALVDEAVATAEAEYTRSGGGHDESN